MLKKLNFKNGYSLVEVLIVGMIVIIVSILLLPELISKNTPNKTYNVASTITNTLLNAKLYALSSTPEQINNNCRDNKMVKLPEQVYVTISKIGEKLSLDTIATSDINTYNEACVLKSDKLINENITISLVNQKYSFSIGTGDLTFYPDKGNELSILLSNAKDKDSASIYLNKNSGLIYQIK